MRNDIRIYNYYDDEPLITRMSQAKTYIDEKFANIHVDIDLTKIDEKLEVIKEEIDDIDLKNISDKITEVGEKVEDAKEEIIDKIDESKPCLCHLATKEDVCQAKCAIIKKVEESKDKIIEEIDEKFVDLNELIKQ